MGTETLAQNPFAVVTFIAAPAVLTNAASVLTLSTITRFLRCADRIRDLSERAAKTNELNVREFCFKQITRVEKQAKDFLKALRTIYFAMGAFVLATVLALLGAIAAGVGEQTVVSWLGSMSLGVGCLGVLALAFSAFKLVQANELAMFNIADEVSLIKQNLITK